MSSTISIPITQYMVSEVYTMYHEGQKKGKIKQFDESIEILSCAIAKYREIISEHSERIPCSLFREMLLYRAKCYGALNKQTLSLGDIKEAINSQRPFDPVENITPDLTMTQALKNLQQSIELNIHAEFSFHRRKTDEAITNYKTALKLNPFNYASCLGLGTIYENLKEYELANNYYNRLVEINPYDEEAQKLIDNVSRIMNRSL